MDQQQFDQTVERIRAAGEIVATLDPAIRSQAFAMLTGQTAGERWSRDGQSDLRLPVAGADVAELAFVVMIEANRDADQDLRDIMAEVGAVTNAKAQPRSLLAKVGRDIAENIAASDGQLTFGPDGLGSEDGYSLARTVGGPAEVLADSARPYIPSRLPYGRPGATINASM